MGAEPNPPMTAGDTDLSDDVYDALVPLDGYGKGTRGGPRPYRYDHDGRSYVVVVGLSDFGDVLVGPVMGCAPGCVPEPAEHRP